MLIGATSLWAIRRFEASPDADTPSKTFPPPRRMRLTISSELAAMVDFTMQPVSFSNGWIQSKFLSFEPSST